MLRAKSKIDIKQRKTPSLFNSKFKNFGSSFESSLLFNKPNTKIAKVKALIVINKGSVDSGAEMPRAGYKVFANKPANIRKTILILTDRKDSTAILWIFTPKERRITKPGRKVR
jgi:hypothetical protein